MKTPLNTGVCVCEAATYSFDYFYYEHSDKKKKHFCITKDIFELGKNKFIRLLPHYTIKLICNVALKL